MKKLLILLLLLPLFLIGQQITVDNNTHTDEYLQRIDFSSVFQDSTNGNVWVASDAEGDETREIQQGRCYQFDAVDDSISFGASLASTSISYWDGLERQTVTTTVSGSVLYSDLSTTRKFGDAYIGTVGNYTHYWHCDEQDSLVVYDCVGSANGTINNAVLASFHAIDNTYRSYQNEIGYSDSSGVLIPIALNSAGIGTGLDVNGSVPTYSGQVKYNAKLVNANVGVFDGVDDAATATSINFDSLGSFEFFIRPYGLDWQTVSNYTGLYQLVGNVLTIGYDGANRFNGDISRITAISPNKTYHWPIQVGAGNVIPDVEPVAYGEDINEGFDFNNWSDNNIISKTSNSFTGSGVFKGGLIQAGKKYRVTAKGTKTGGVLKFPNTYIGDVLDDVFNVSIISSEVAIPNLYIFVTGDTNTVVFEKLIFEEVFEPINLEIQNANLNPDLPDPFWQKDDTGKIEPRNLIYGFDLYSDDAHPLDERYNAYWPFYTNNDTIPSPTGYTFVSRNLAGEYHNKAETELKQFLAPALIDYDPGFWFTDGVANPKSWEEIPTNYRLKVFSDKASYQLDNVGLGTISDIKIFNDYLPAKIEVAQ